MMTATQMVCVEVNKTKNDFFGDSTEPEQSSKCVEIVKCWIKGKETNAAVAKFAPMLSLCQSMHGEKATTSPQQQKSSARESIWQLSGVTADWSFNSCFDFLTCWSTCLCGENAIPLKKTEKRQQQ